MTMPMPAAPFQAAMVPGFQPMAMAIQVPVSMGPMPAIQLQPTQPMAFQQAVLVPVAALPAMSAMPMCASMVPTAPALPSRPSSECLDLDHSFSRSTTEGTESELSHWILNLSWSSVEDFAYEMHRYRCLDDVRQCCSWDNLLLLAFGWFSDLLVPEATWMVPAVASGTCPNVQRAVVRSNVSCTASPMWRDWAWPWSYGAESPWRPGRHVPIMYYRSWSKCLVSWSEWNFFKRIWVW